MRFMLKFTCITTGETHLKAANDAYSLQSASLAIPCQLELHTVCAKKMHGGSNGLHSKTICAWTLDLIPTLHTVGMICK